MLGLENVGSYMQAKQAHKLSDWSEVLLESEGKIVQEEMTKKFQVGVVDTAWCMLSNFLRCFHYVGLRRCSQSPLTSLKGQPRPTKLRVACGVN